MECGIHVPSSCGWDHALTAAKLSREGLMAIIADMYSMSKLAALTALVWATPPRYWHQLAHLGIGNHEDRSDPCCAIYRQALAIYDEKFLSALCAARRVSLREAKIQVLGLAGPWRQWRPPIRLFGEQHLLAALRRGKGVILWASPSTYSHLVFKIALTQAGHPITQLSRPTHGFGPSPRDIRLLNPIWMRVEERFLQERVLIEGVETKPAIRRLKARLAENGIVVITIGNEARRTVEVPFLEHRLRVATGPAFIAQSTGAALVPGFAVRGNDGTYEVTLESPLPVPPRDAGPERLVEVAAALARRIDPYARRFPEQWSGWSELIPDCPPPVFSAEEGLG
jgi:lauroyl/myristoyl acyltransferase